MLEDVEGEGGGAGSPHWREGHCPAVVLRSSPGCSLSTAVRRRESLTTEKDSYEGPVLKQHAIKRWKGKKGFERQPLGLAFWLLEAQVGTDEPR